MKKLFITGILISTLLLAACSKANTDSNPVSEGTVTEDIADNTVTEDTGAKDTTTGNATTDATATPSGEEFTIGILPAESAIPIILAKENGISMRLVFR